MTARNTDHLDWFTGTKLSKQSYHTDKFIHGAHACIKQKPISKSQHLQIKANCITIKSTCTAKLFHLDDNLNLVLHAVTLA